ncbi:MAG: peptidylprolyl isomerase [Gammaproteobacteria bacterium]
MAAASAGSGKVVTFTYSISDDSGEILEQSDLPISYVHGGKHDLFEKVEDAMDGAAVGDSIDVRLSPEEGFGAHDPRLTYIDDVENVPPEFQHIGADVEMMNDQGESMKFTVTSIDNGKLTVDGNHPMAGKSITFHIKIIDIRTATPDEIVNGVEAMPMPVLH